MSKEYTLNPNLSEVDRYKALLARLMLHCFEKGDPNITIAIVCAALDLGLEVKNDINAVVDNIRPTLDKLDSVEDSNRFGMSLAGLVYEVVSNFTKDGSTYTVSDEAKKKAFEIVHPQRPRGNDLEDMLRQLMPGAFNG